MLVVLTNLIIFVSLMICHCLQWIYWGNGFGFLWQPCLDLKMGLGLILWHCCNECEAWLWGLHLGQVVLTCFRRWSGSHWNENSEAEKYKIEFKDRERRRKLYKDERFETSIDGWRQKWRDGGVAMGWGCAGGGEQ